MQIKLQLQVTKTTISQMTLEDLDATIVPKNANPEPNGEEY
jgi:hypothetical protein